MARVTSVTGASRVSRGGGSRLLRHGGWLALAVTAVLLGAVVHRVDLRPRVDRHFFFGSDSEALRQASRIGELFRTQTQLVVIARSSRLGSPEYARRIDRLTRALSEVDGVTTVKSLASGPDGLEDARESPLWSRLLLAEDASATHLIAFVEEEGWPPDLVPSIERIAEEFEAPDFALELAGVPYTVTVMQRRLVRDFAVFSGAAVLVFGVAIVLIFRSLAILVGTLVACLAAVSATLLLLRAFGGGIGLLTANLTTIVFVLTQSHIVFMASNWRELGRELGRELECEPRREPDGGGGEAGRVGRAWRQTLRASTWSMLTTLLGFGTLLLVEAKPLRQLGEGGLVGAGAALVCAYLLFPPFLARARAPRAHRGRGRFGRWTRRRMGGAALAFGALGVLLAAGLPRLETDPSLLEYFREGGRVRSALAHLDHHGGSTPLELVVRREDGARLDGGSSYERMWSLQQALEAQDLVGRVVSLPVVMAEGDRLPLSFLLTWDWTLDLMGTGLGGRVADSFVTEDRRQALFVLQMVEHRRERARLDVVAELRDVAAERGMEVTHVGGIYYLQGALSELVTGSLVRSLALLVPLFFAIAWLAGGSLAAAVAMPLALGLVAAASLGAFGWLGLPLDLVAAPAASVGLGLGADAALHLVVAVRRARERGAEGLDAWAEGRGSQWRGILRSTGVVAAGFALFVLSGFPPTQRFGVLVALATLLAAPAALWALPELASRWERRRGR